MKNHLSEHQLVDHLFRLDDKGSSRSAEQHLAECAECHAERDRLQQKFASLDSLRDTTEASETLIADTLRRIRLDQPARTVWFPRWAWGLASAAAAAVLLAVVWTGHPPQPQVLTLAKSAEAPAPAPELARHEQKEAVMELAMDKPMAASVSAPAEQPAVDGELLMAQAPSGGRGLAEDRIFEAEAPPPAARAAKSMRRGGEVAAEWRTHASTPGVTVEVTRQKPGADAAVQEWKVTAANTGDVPAAVRLERSFTSATWEVTTAATNVSVVRDSERKVLVTFDLAPTERREFGLTVAQAARDDDLRE